MTAVQPVESGNITGASALGLPVTVQPQATEPSASITNRPGISDATSRTLANLAKLTSPLEQTSIVQLISGLISDGTIDSVKQLAQEYISGFQHRPVAQVDGSNVTYKDPVTYSIDDSSLQKVTDLVLEAASDRKITVEVLKRVLFKKEVIAKLAVIYEHSFMLGANKDEDKENVIRKLIRQFTSDDAAIRFIKEQMPLSTYDLLMANPELYARAVITHRWVCRKHSIDPNDVQKQIAFQNGKNLIAGEISKQITRADGRKSLRLMIANLRQEAPIPCDPSVCIGETLFFQPLIDSETLSPVQYLLDAFERGVRNIEISADLLPFDPTKRLPGEYTDEEISRIRELGKTLGLTFTVHSPIVGPLNQKTKFTAVLEDAADNVQIMKDTIDFASKLGARTVVVHISDRNSDEAILKYAEIASYANGKYSALGSPLRIAFENYMSKALPDGSRPFPTMEEHFKPFSKIVKQVAKNAIELGQNPVNALKHCALLLDSAHFNLVPNMEDPLNAPFILKGLANELATNLINDPEIGSKLQENGFNKEKFVNNIVAQLHLNQNIGPIVFTVPGKDYNADIHNPVESIGTIDNIGFVALVQDAGFGGENSELVVLAEQKKRLSPGGLQLLYNAVKDCPATLQPSGEARVNHFETLGRYAVQQLYIEHHKEFEPYQKLIETDKGTIRPIYAYIAGRLGLDHLLEQLKRRTLHLILAAHYDHLPLGDIENLPVQDVVLNHYDSGELIIKRGTTYKEAIEKGTNRFYIIAKGTVEVVKENGDKIELKAGTPFGEAMFLSGLPRNADVVAGPNGATLVEISESDFWNMYKFLVPFQERLDTHFVKRTDGEH